MGPALLELYSTPCSVKRNVIEKSKTYQLIEESTEERHVTRTSSMNNEKPKNVKVGFKSVSSFHSLPIVSKTVSTTSKTYSVKYIGNCILDLRYTSSMLPWIISDIKRSSILGSGNRKAKDIKLEISNFGIKAIYQNEKQPLFVHPLQFINKFSTSSQDPCCFVYLFHDHTDAPFNCYVFQADNEHLVLEVITALKEAVKATSSQNESSLFGKNYFSALDNILCNSQQYEVMYIGRIKVYQKRAPPSFIDEAVEQLKKSSKKQVKFNSLNETENEPNVEQHNICTDLKSLENMSHNNLSMTKPVLLSTCKESKEPHKEESLIDFKTPSPVETLKKPLITCTHHSQDEEDDVGIIIDSEDSLKVQTSDGKSLSCTSLHLPSSSLITNTQSLDDAGRASIRRDLEVCSKNKDNKLLTCNLEQSSRIRSISGDIPRNNQKQVSLPYRTRTNSGGSSDLRRSRQSTKYQNRTMLFLIGRTEICLISPDQQQVLFSKPFNYVSHCSQGVKYRDHFGFICRESAFYANDSYMGYVFRCQTDKVVNEIMHALKQAFHNAHQAYQANKNKSIMICESCPMQWFHRLCCDLENTSPEQAQKIIFNSLESFLEQEKLDIMSQYEGAQVNSIQEQNELFMMLFRGMCERKQTKHLHKDERAGTGSTLDNLKQKAKKSISTSFETILKGREKFFNKNLSPAHRSRSSTIACPFKTSLQFAGGDNTDDSSYSSFTSGHCEFSFDDYSLSRPRSLTFGGVFKELKTPEDGNEKKVFIHSESTPVHHTQSSKSHFYNIFFKIGKQKTSSSKASDESLDASLEESNNIPQPPNRRAIFSIIQSATKDYGKKEFKNGQIEDVSPRKKTKKELRDLWKKAINQQIVLIQMEKENQKLQANQNEVELKRMKLDYEEIIPDCKETNQAWDDIFSKPTSKPGFKADLKAAIQSGVPKLKRGEIWLFLANYNKKILKPISEITNNTPYRQLLQQLTSQQHAILVDLGRTFPKHPYFTKPLGSGQLSLFNLLKAYSLFDKEVGYCQGLSFVAAILLLHMSEDEAFEMMKYLLFHLGLRSQYKPDMSELQIQLYKLTRLLYDLHQDIYEHFETYDIRATLYAAPWFLTLFASQFPISFVVRLFDMIFFLGIEAIYRLSISLLATFKDTILECRSFESIMEFLKLDLIQMDTSKMEQVFNQIILLDIREQLAVYEIEYNVIKEDLQLSVSTNVSEIEDSSIVLNSRILELENENRLLKSQNMEILDQLHVAQSNVHTLESSLETYKSSIKRLESRVRSMEVERDALLQSVNMLRKKTTVVSH